MTKSTSLPKSCGDSWEHGSSCSHPTKTQKTTRAAHNLISTMTLAAVHSSKNTTRTRTLSYLRNGQSSLEWTSVCSITLLHRQTHLKQILDTSQTVVGAETAQPAEKKKKSAPTFTSDDLGYPILPPMEETTGSNLETQKTLIRAFLNTHYGR